MISEQMKSALNACLVARVQYRADPTQERLSLWDDAWQALMEVKYQQPKITDETWCGLAQREEELMPDAMKATALAQFEQRINRIGTLVQ